MLETTVSKIFFSFADLGVGGVWGVEVAMTVTKLVLMVLFKDCGTP